MGQVLGKQIAYCIDASAGFPKPQKMQIKDRDALPVPFLHFFSPLQALTMGQTLLESLKTVTICSYLDIGPIEFHALYYMNYIVQRTGLLMCACRF